MSDELAIQIACFAIACGFLGFVVGVQFGAWCEVQDMKIAGRMCEMPRSEVDPNDREAMAELCKRATTSKLDLTRGRLNLEAKLRAEGR